MEVCNVRFRLGEAKGFIIIGVSIVLVDLNLNCDCLLKKLSSLNE